MADIVIVSEEDSYTLDLIKELAATGIKTKLMQNPTELTSELIATSPAIVLLAEKIVNQTYKDLYSIISNNSKTKHIMCLVIVSTLTSQIETDINLLGLEDLIEKAKPTEVIVSKLKNKLKKTQFHTRTHVSLNRADTAIRCLLPRITFQGLNTSVLYRPLDVIGGDFYDFLRTGAGNECLLIGDVSGHGVEAAVLQTMIRKTIQIYIRSCFTIEEALSHVNEELVRDLPKGLFVGLSVAEWHPHNQTIKFMRFGVPHPLIKKRDGTIRSIMSGGTILGMHPKKRFDQFIDSKEISLSDGDTLLLFTDGIIEANDITGKEIGNDGLRKALKESNSEDIQVMLNNCFSSIEKQVREFDDDITMLAMQLDEAQAIPIHEETN